MFHSHSSKEPADFSQERYAHTDDPSYQMPQSDDSDFGGRKKFSIFRPRLSKPNLLISICINTLRLFALVIVLGIVFGLVQGFCVGYLNIQPFIVTMAGMFFARGMTAGYSERPNLV